jgi:hypothetical protein
LCDCCPSCIRLFREGGAPMMLLIGMMVLFAAIIISVVCLAVSIIVD